MIDGTHLPCVVIEGASRTVDLAMKRFEETSLSSDSYSGHRAIVTSFVTQRNTVNDYDLKELVFNPYTILLSMMEDIKGETSMGGTGFYVKMRDGKEFRFGSTFLMEFFDMPSNYSATDIVKIIPVVRGEKRKQDMYIEKSLSLHAM